MIQEIFKLVYSRYDKKVQVPNLRYIHTVGSTFSNGDLSDDTPSITYGM